jgi:hypothetical protein
LKHYADPDFWSPYHRLPDAIRQLADKNFALLKANSNRPSLRFKKIGPVHPVRVGRHYRALAMDHPDGLQWFWIGHHSDYDRLLSGK